MSLPPAIESSPNIDDRHIYSLGTDSLVWKEHELEPVGLGTDGQLLPEMYFHSKMESVTLPILGGFNVTAPVASTYMVGGPMIRRVFRPLELQFSGTTPVGEFIAGVQLFGGMKQLSDADLANDIHSAVESSGCTQVGQFRTSWNSPFRARLGSFSNVTFEKDLGLVLKADQGGLPAWMGHVSEALINHDGLDDQPNMVLNGFNGCAAQPIVDFESLTPGYHGDPKTGEGMDPRRVAVGVDGLYGTQPETGRVIRLQPGIGISTVANVPFIAGAGIGAYPPQLGNVHATTVIVRIDSPVEVVVSDAARAPAGRDCGSADQRIRPVGPRHRAGVAPAFLCDQPSAAGTLRGAQRRHRRRAFHRARVFGEHDHRCEPASVVQWHGGAWRDQQARLHARRQWRDRARQRGADRQRRR